jgi:hypothetical protein
VQREEKLFAFLGRWNDREWGMGKLVCACKITGVRWLFNVVIWSLASLVDEAKNCKREVEDDYPSPIF